MTAITLSAETLAKIQHAIKNGQIELTAGAIKRAFENEGEIKEAAILQLVNFKWTDENGAPGTCARGKMHDGVHYYKFFFFSSDLANQMRRENLVGKTDMAAGLGGEIILLTRAHYSLANKTKNGSAVFVVDEYQLLSRGNHCLDAKMVEHQGTPEAIDLYRSYKPTTFLSVPWNGPTEMPAPQAVRSAAPPAQTTRAAPQRGNTGLGGGNIIPINMLTPYLPKWRILGVCTDAEPMREINTARGPTKVFNFTLTDKQGSGIRLAAFGEAAVRGSSLIQVDCTYYISGGQVKQANKRFNTTGHDYEITLRNDTEITPCNENIGKPAFSLKICPLDRIACHKDETVDVLAVVDKLEPITEFVAKTSGKEMTKRDVILIDKTKTQVTFTLWNEQARLFEEEALHQVIGIKGANVKEWNGGVSLGSVGGTKWELTPSLPEVPALYEWYRDERPSSDIRSLTVTNTGSDSLSRDLRLTSTFQALQLGNEPELPNGRYMLVRARIIEFRSDNALYQACPNDGCQKKVVQLDNQYRCEKCNTTSDSFKWHFMLSMELSDGVSGNFWVTAFGPTAEKIVGKPAQEMGELKEYDAEAYAKVFAQRRNVPFLFKIRAKPETYNEEMRIRYSVFEFQEVNWEKYNHELERALGSMSNLG